MNAEGLQQPPWWVIHSRPRCEKKLAEYCNEKGTMVELPIFRSVRRYRGKTVTFQKPIFPGYLFVRIQEGNEDTISSNRYVANLLKVLDQAVFEDQLRTIQAALATGVEVRLAPQVNQGSRVKVRNGPLRGLEGYVEGRTGILEVHLRLDFIGQAAMVTLDADNLEVM